MAPVNEPDYPTQCATVPEKINRSERGMTPNDLARRLGIGIHKVLTWINRGELRALNVASDPGGRPQWVILPEHLAAFEARRAAGPKPATVRKKRAKDTGIIQYF